MICILFTCDDCGADVVVHQSQDSVRYPLSAYCGLCGFLTILPDLVVSPPDAGVSQPLASFSLLR